MKVEKRIEDVKKILKGVENKKIGFVPTMGYLHDGHLSLIKKAREDNDFVVVSVYVNPTQFGENEDLDSYPRDLKRDQELIKDYCDLLFIPENSEIYPNGYNTFVSVKGRITEILCAKNRPTHFKGVTTIVAKLFNIVEPDNVYFGLKDFQQFKVIEKMINELNLNINIHGCEIIREKTGLAMSSRNSYLSDKEKEDALILYKSLISTREKINNNERNVKKLIEEVKNNIENLGYPIIDYIEILDYETLEEIDEVKDKSIMLMAVKFNNTRLIDNMIMEV